MLTNRQQIAKGILESLCSDNQNLVGLHASADQYKVDPAMFVVQTALNMADIFITLTTVKKPKKVAAPKPKMKRTRKSKKIKGDFPEADDFKESCPNGYR